VIGRGGTGVAADARKYPATTAAMTTSGNGTLKKKMATNAAPATSQSTAPRSARRPRRISASSTIASTAAFTPVKRAATNGALP
jgi:hypothetical protein